MEFMEDSVILKKEEYNFILSKAKNEEYLKQKIERMSLLLDMIEEGVLSHE